MSFLRYPSYKDSGVKWLGEVPNGWGIKRIKHLFEIKKRISGAEGYEVLSITQQGIKIKDIVSGDGQLSMDYSKYQFVEIGDFAMNHMDLLTGYVDISRVFGVTSPDYRVFSVRDDEVCFDRYYLYLFQMGYRNKIFYAFGQGSSQLGRWRFPTEQFNGFEFPSPSIQEQKQIAAFLDRETAKIDALIAEQQRLIELLKEKRQAVISHAVTIGLNPNAPMKSSGIGWLGNVPEHWGVVKLFFLTSKIGDGLHGTPEYVDDSEFYFINGNNLSKGFISITISTRCVTRDEFEKHKVLLDDSTLLMSINGTIGSVAFYRGEPVMLGKSAAYINCSDELFRNFLYFYLQSSLIKSYFYLEVTGTTIFNLSLESIRNLHIALPPLEEQKTITTFLDSETAKLDTLTNEAKSAITLLQERRTALISAAVTGKIDVRGLVSVNPEVEQAA